MLHTRPLDHIHRDKLRRVIRLGDYVVWANGKQGNGLVICTVQGSSSEKLRLARHDTGRMTNARPENLIVITHQVIRNMEGNVGANIDLEATRPT